MDDIWTKVGKLLGRLLAVTIVLCAWAIIVTVTLKLLWFTVFRVLV